MSERKVLSKYYPPDFDPNALKRRRGPKDAGPKVATVRLMAPLYVSCPPLPPLLPPQRTQVLVLTPGSSMRCTSCGEYVYKGRKFNARKESRDEEKYLGQIQIHRFHIKCTRCSAEIIFKTDPKNQDYAVVKGAKRNVEPWRQRGAGEAEETDEQRLDRVEAEEAEAEEQDRMQELEAKTVDAKREMDVADALDEIRTRNARLERADRDGLQPHVVRPEDEERARQDREDDEAARAAFAFARMQDRLEEVVDDDIPEEEPPAETSVSYGSTTVASTSMPPPPIPVKVAPIPEEGAAAAAAPTFKRQVKKKKDHAALLGIKKKAALA